MVAGSQLHPQVVGSWTMPVPQVVGHSQAQVEVLRTFGVVQVLLQTHPQVVGSWTLPVPQVAAGHSQVQPLLSDFGLVQLGTQAPLQRVKPVSQVTGAGEPSKQMPFWGSPVG